MVAGRVGVVLGAVATLAAGCGGSEVRAWRSDDPGGSTGGSTSFDGGVPSSGGATPTGGAPATGGSPANGGASSLDAGPCGAAPPPDWRTTLSCGTAPLCSVTGVRLASGSSVHAFGISHPSEGGDPVVWEFDGGSETPVRLLPEMSVNELVATMYPEGLVVRDFSGRGPVLGLTGIAMNGSVRADWILTTDHSPPVNLGGSYRPLNRTVALFAFIGDEDGSATFDGTFDTFGNPVWGAALSNVGAHAGTSGPSGRVVLAADQDSNFHAYFYWTDTGNGDIDPLRPPDPGYPRLADHLARSDFVTGAPGWDAPLDVHAIVRISAGESGVVMAGLLQADDLPDVQSFDGSGSLRWGARPVLGEAIESLAVRTDSVGRALVAWNSGTHFTLQRYETDGSLCNEWTLAGTASDLGVLSDGHVAVATDRELLTIRP